MKFLKFYQHFYYKIYKSIEYTSSPKFWTEWKTFVVLLVLETWIFLSLRFYYHYIFNVPLKNTNSVLDFYTVVVGALLIVGNWYLFEYRDKWKGIVADYNKSPKNKLMSYLTLFIVLVITIAFWTSIFFVLPKLNYI